MPLLTVFVFIVGVLLKVGKAIGLGSCGGRISGRAFETATIGWFKDLWIKENLRDFLLSFIFHLSAVIVILFAPAHSELWSWLTGLNWPSIACRTHTAWTVFSADSLSIVLLASGGVKLFKRLGKYLKSQIVEITDFLEILIFYLAVLTGFLAAHGVGDYSTMLALHYLFVQIVIMYSPFTKYFHPFYALVSRVAFELER